MGRKTIKEIAIDVAKEDANKVINALTPFINQLAKCCTERSCSRMPLKPQKIRDRWQYLAESFGLGNEYKGISWQAKQGLQ